MVRAEKIYIYIYTYRLNHLSLGFNVHTYIYTCKYSKKEVINLKEQGNIHGRFWRKNGEESYYVITLLFLSQRKFNKN